MKKITVFMFTFLLSLSHAAFAAVDFSGWTKFAESMQVCKPGTFDLPDPLQMALTSTPGNVSYQIMGISEGNCKVVITRIIQAQGQAPTALKLNCTFSIDDLPTLSKTALETGKGSLSTDDPSSQIMNNACKSEN